MCELAMTATITYYEKPYADSDKFVLQPDAAERAELANLLLQVLLRLRDSTLAGMERQLSGIWNCESWLTRAIESREGIGTAHISKNKREGRITLDIMGAQLQIAVSKTYVDLSNRICFGNAPRRKPTNVGNLVQLTFVKAVDHTVKCWFEARWFAVSGDDIPTAVTHDDLLKSDWCFPQPMYCELIGQGQHMRAWIALLKLSI